MSNHSNHSNADVEKLTREQEQSPLDSLLALPHKQADNEIEITRQELIRLKERADILNDLVSFEIFVVKQDWCAICGDPTCRCLDARIIRYILVSKKKHQDHGQWKYRSSKVVTLSGRPLDELVSNMRNMTGDERGLVKAFQKLTPSQLVEEVQMQMGLIPRPERVKRRPMQGFVGWDLDDISTWNPSLTPPSLGEAAVAWTDPITPSLGENKTSTDLIEPSI